MIKLKYELKKEEFEENEKTVEMNIVQITAETNHPNTYITFEKSNKPLAQTVTDTDGAAMCGFSPQSRKCVVKAKVGKDSAKITIPKATDLK